MRVSSHLKRAGRQIFVKLPDALQRQIAQHYCHYKSKRVRQDKVPRTVIFFITSRCNLRCGHCFFWKELNAGAAELNIDEIDKISQTLTKPVSLSLTGGEPFIRKDIPDICEVFEKNCGIGALGIATNGTFTEKIMNDVHCLLKSKRYPDLSVQVSLDGPEAIHDDIRGVSGSFFKAMMTLKELMVLKESYPALSVHAAVAVQKRNLQVLPELINYLSPFNIPLRFNIVRGGSFGVFKLPIKAANDFDPKDEEGSFLTIEELKTTFNLLKGLNGRDGYWFWSRRQEKIWELSIEILECQHCTIPCFANVMETVLYPQGDVAFCELSKPFSNIRSYNYNFKELLNSKESEKMRHLISRCFCIHGCNLSTGLTFDPETVVSVLKNKR